ncbi:hypothetical protein [Vannielia litorea]|uniref:hypothetical protein n=1 Tax=Vannielia litorea TaxID=1217970 RepID=UPI001C972845|nr:hypothetical protein [Vannielia litorea]MBY6049610.1 hypothetical protein [Vannielia litorea]MBY6077024.1 hypothetical protein [Vannielia litorea]
MNPFVIPPRIASGEFGFGVVGDGIPHTEVEWNHLAEGLDNGDGMVTTSIGKAEVDGRKVSFVLGYQAEDMLPFLSFTVFAPVEKTSWCTFNFSEVQQ